MAQYQINKYAYALNLELTFTLISQNISNNTSVVRVLGRVVGTGNGEGAWGGAGRTGTITFNGVTESFNSGKDYNFPNATAVNHVLFQKDYTVAHNADGTKSVSGSITWKHDNAYFNSNAGTNTASVSITNQSLTTIPRASSFTLGGATQTNASISVTISRASTAFTHRVRWRVGSGSWINVASAATTSASFTVQPGNMPNLKTATITVGVQTYNGTTAIGSEATATRTITIPNSTISISGTANTGSAQTVNITNSGGSLSYTRSWKLGSATGGNVASWTPPHSALPSATSGTLTCTVTTKNGTATINTVSATRTITVPTSVLPTFTAITHSEAVSDVNTKVGAYVQNKTKLTLGVTNPVAGSGSSIKSYAISVAGHTVGNGGTTGVITQSGTLTITATVTDNRNRTATKTTTISVLAYENPTITGVSFTRSNSDGTPNTTGTYLTIKATVKVRRLLVGSVEKNKINYQSQSAQKGGSYTTKTNLANQAGTVSGNYRQAVYTHTFDTTDPTHGGYHVDYPYDVRVRGGDIFSWSGYIAGGIPTGVVLQHWGEDTTAFGKMIDDVNYNVLVGAKGLKSDGPIVAGGSNVMVDLDLTSQVQLTSYRYSVIALCELTNTNTSFNSYSNGVLTFHRPNSLMGEVRINIGMAKRYNTTKPNVTMLSQAVNQGVVPCTFTYNGVKYGGVRVYISDAEFNEVHFYGVTNFKIFGLDYYSTQGSQILNSEVNSSLNLNDHFYTGSLYFQNQPVDTSSILAKVYPIGSIFISTVNTNPSNFIGGTWVAFGAGRTIVGVDTSQTEFNTVEKTGGHKQLQSHSHTATTASGGAHTHTASTASAGAHSHKQDNRTWMNIASMVRMPASGSYYATTNQSGEGGVGTTLSAGAHTHTVTVNSGGAHSHTTTIASTGGGNAQNLQPYITVYMWKRTA